MHDDPTRRYRASRGVNWSTLSAMRVSPAAYHHRLTTPRAASPQMVLGSLIHACVLEPATVAARYAVWDGGRRGTNAHKAWCEENAGRDQITAADMGTAEAVAAAVWAHPTARKVLAGGRTEVPIKWTDPTTRMRCKGLADHIRYGRKETALTDLKTTRDVMPRAFGRSVEAFGMHGQLAFYRGGLDALGMKPGPVRIVAVAQEPPHEVAVYVVPDEVLDAGRDLVDELLEKVKLWRRRRRWPVRYEKETPLQFPRWALPEYSDDIVMIP